MRATPLAQSRKQGPIFFCVDFVECAKARARYFPTALTPVRRAHASWIDAQHSKRVGTAYDGLCYVERRCHRLCPPYDPPHVFWQIETNTTPAPRHCPAHRLRLI